MVSEASLSVRFTGVCGSFDGVCLDDFREERPGVGASFMRAYVVGCGKRERKDKVRKLREY